MTDLIDYNSTITTDQCYFDNYTVTATLDELQKGVTVSIGGKLVRFKKIFDHDKSFKKLLVKTNIVLAALSTVLFLLPMPLPILGIMPIGCIISHTWIYWDKKRRITVKHR